MNAEFLAMAMLAARGAFVVLIDEAGHGTKRFPTERWRNVEMPVPPLRDQLAIVSRVESELALMAASAEKEAAAITLLREYRTRLFSDVLTGQLDVRAAAAALPDELPDAAPLDDAEPQDDDNLDDAEATPEADEG